MTQDEILRLCNDLGQTSWYGTHSDGTNTFTGVKFTAKELEVFVERVAAHEREACAKVCEEGAGSYVNSYYTKGLAHGARLWARLCAAAIRARGEK